MSYFLAQNPDLMAKFHETILSLIQLALLALVSLISYAVRLYIDRLNSGWKKAVAERIVAFAEQRFPGANDQKLQYASMAVSQHFPSIKQDEVQHLIEEAVVNLKVKLGGAQ